MSALDRQSRRALVVCAPGFEVLFFGGLLLQYPGDWTVFACSRDNAVNMPLACRALGSNSQTIGDIALLDLTQFDVIVTHNSMGEGVLPQAVPIWTSIAKRLPDGVEMYSCGYGRQLNPVAIEVDLNKAELKAKMAALQIYQLPTKYNGMLIPYWQALLIQYGTAGINTGFDLSTETYARE